MDVETATSFQCAEIPHTDVTILEGHTSEVCCCHIVFSGYNVWVGRGLHVDGLIIWAGIHLCLESNWVPIGIWVRIMGFRLVLFHSDITILCFKIPFMFFKQFRRFNCKDMDDSRWTIRSHCTNCSL